MVAELTDRAKDMALMLLFLNADLGLTRKGQEVSDTGYQRRPILPTTPAGEARGARIVRNSEEIKFGPWVEDAPEKIDGWFVTTTDGVMARGDFDAKARRRPERGDELLIHSGELVLGLR